MLSIQLDPSIEKRLSELARRTGQSEDACARELIENHLEELEDQFTAERRLREKHLPLTSRQVRKELGLEH